jgi:integrase
VIDARAKSTVEKYAGGFSRFVKWTEQYRELSCILPCPEIYVGLYLQNLMESAQHFSVIESAYYSIKWAHSLAGVNNPCDSEVITYLVDAASRKLNRPIKKKESVTLDKLFAKYNTVDRTLKDLWLLTPCSLAYAVFVRYNELCNIKAKHIKMYDHYVDIFVEKSKTDCYRKGNHVIISRLDSLQCPVKILSSYLREALIELASDMYIFRPISFLAHLTRSELLPSLGVHRPSVNISIFF